ncbi:hypothetical protein [Metabacillus sediminilitoris]|uniref:Uncharacterized protein n=1 Tax=Metabacillus sediminilitoris TaxID=2567941 RepID=A0A4V3WF82_9BACI|nr:hypothetical protein [Metabacillus sediminilitoris]QGQ46196.1 hypothetical protein GMB29_13800 [Metabacillus sediminilitoris]THF79249.1 hypothetical protein E6W99_12910 [Metabacillus sediminilitoris]
MKQNLIEIYIQEVTRRLPEKSREDIGLELRSTIEDMLPDNYTEEDVKLSLEKLGNPVTLASGYRDQPLHLIGPRYYDIYLSLLKMILPIAGVVVLLSMITEYFIGYSGQEAVLNVVLAIMGEGIWGLLEVGFQVFFWLTLVFAIIERTDKRKDNQPLTTSFNKWTPDDLKNITYIPKKKAITKCEVFGSLLWTAIWATLYFYANHLVGVYKGIGNGLDFIIPALNQEVLFRYWVIVVIVIGLEITLAIYKFIKGQWTKKVALFNAVIEVIATIVTTVIVINPDLLQQEFILYMTDLFNLTAGQFQAWLVGGIILIFVVTAIINVLDGFRKARHH